MSFDSDEEKKNVQSPLTRQLLKKIERNFIEEIYEKRFDSSVKEDIIRTYKKTAENTFDTFIRDLLTEAVQNFRGEDRRKKKRGRRRTDGI